MQTATPDDHRDPSRERAGRGVADLSRDRAGTLAEIPVVVNANAGNVESGDARAQIVDAFARHGLRARAVAPAPGQQIADVVDALLEAGARVVVAAGGDGTVNAVAARLLDRDAVLGVLPLGTLNHFARDLGIGFDLDTAVAVIAARGEVACDVGEANEHIFLNNSGIGLYPRIVSEREREQKQHGANKWPAMLRATWDALRHPSSIEVAVCVEGRTIRRRTPFVFVGNNGYVSEGLALGRRTRLDGGVLSLFILRQKSAFGFVWLALRSLLGMGSRAGDFDAFQAVDVQVHLRRGHVDVSADGEVMPMASPVCYRIRPLALRVFAPPPARNGAPA